MLLGPIALFKLKVFITSSIFSAVVVDKKNVFVFLCQERTELLLISLRNFLSSFPAIDMKKLWKWFVMIKSSDVVLLSIFKVI